MLTAEGFVQSDLIGGAGAFSAGGDICVGFSRGLLLMVSFVPLCFSFCRVPQCVLLMVSFVPLCFSRGLTILNFYLENPD
jgi:hypothetical protein